MTGARGQVLVLGAYSFVGECIVAGLLERTDRAVVATGRDPAKLKRLEERRRHPRLSTSRLDALDGTALARACQQSDIVINCVGPYIVSGCEIATTVVQNRCHYLDFAFEQFHYRRLEGLAQLARANDVALVTGAGEVVGISSILSAYAATRLPGLDRLGVYYLEGTLHDGETGFSSIMNGALEPALGNRDYVDGRHVPARMGAEIVERWFPEPHGRTKLLCDPTIDSFILAERFRLRTIKNYFGMGMDVPFGFFPLMRLLNPYRNRWLYRWTGRIVRRMMQKNYSSQAKRGGSVRWPLLRVEVQSGRSQMTLEVQFSREFNGTAILPILIGAMLARGEIAARGLLTAMDIVPPERLLEELEGYRRTSDLRFTIEGPSPLGAASAA